MNSHAFFIRAEKARSCGAFGRNEIGLGIAFGAFGRKKLDLWSLRAERVPGLTNKEEDFTDEERNRRRRRSEKQPDNTMPLPVTKGGLRNAHLALKKAMSVWKATEKRNQGAADGEVPDDVAEVWTELKEAVEDVAALLRNTEAQGSYM